MTTVETDSTFTLSDENEDGYLQYRELSMPAVASLVLGIVSFTAIPFVTLAVIPFLGMVLGFRAMSQIKLRPRELTGLQIAKTGCILSAILLVASITFKIYDYSTEVPENYARIGWPDLQPDKENRPELPVSPESLDLHDKQIFIKGYVYPDGRKKGLKSFIMVPDRGTCCFGGQPPLTHMIEVTFQNELTVDYSFRKRKLGGILKVDADRPKPVTGLNGVYYQLEADYLK